jgi:hypothetical protein
VPSPKLQLYVNGGFPFVVVAAHVTVRLAFVQVKSTVKGATTTMLLIVPDAPFASVTVKVAVKVLDKV